MILLIDNYDSFTYNLYHQFGQFNSDIQVVRNDAITLQEIEALNPSAIVLSPGPGTPIEAGICIACIKTFYKRIPILGVCLGHQAIGEAFGAIVEKAANIIHGKTSTLAYEKSGLFQHLNGELEVMRYHSLVINPSTLPIDFAIDAFSSDDNEIMAIHHKQYPLFGVQFHPESIGTEFGDQLIQAFLNHVNMSSKI